MKSTPQPLLVFCYFFAIVVSLASLRADLSGPHIIEWKKSYTGPGNAPDYAIATAVDRWGNVLVTGSTFNTNSGSFYYTAKYAAATGVLIWENTFNSKNGAGDQPSAIAVDASGNVIVSGYSMNNGSEDYYTAKYAAADGSLLWKKTYNGTGDHSDIAYAIAVDSADNVIVTGTSYGKGGNYDYYTAKYSAANGSLLWSKRYNGTGNRNDQANAVTLDASGNVIVTGFSASVAGGDDFYTAKYAAATGAILWEKRYNGTGNTTDQANAVATDPSGNVIVTGNSYDTSSDSDYYTAKYAAANGALLWEIRYNGPSNTTDEANAIAVDASGNVIVTGRSYDVTGYFTCYTAKYAAATGALVWDKRYNPANVHSKANAIALDRSGNVVITGNFYNRNKSYTDSYTAKYAAADGALLWQKLHMGTGGQHDEFFALAVDFKGHVVVTGYSHVADGTIAGNDIYTAKYDTTTGALLWDKRYNGPYYSYDKLNASALDSSGNLIVTGRASSQSSDDYYTAKYAGKDGALIWEKYYDNPENSYDEATALAVDPSGNVCVTGYSSSIKGRGDYFTAKYAAADGALLWGKRHNFAGNNSDRPAAIAVDTIGNVIVTGYSDTPDGPDYYTAKYAAATGDLLWFKSYNSPDNGHDKATAVAVDASGNVIVTGYSYTAEGGDYYTVKYAAATGAQLWAKRYNSPENRNDGAHAIAVDAAGNVVVTGSSHKVSTGFDCFTVKYAAATGAVIWGKRYNSPENGDDVARAIALDSSGNAIIICNSTNRTSETDYYTAKYDAATGATLWENRYDSGNNGIDEPNALAVDASGNVVVTGSSQNADFSEDFYTAAYAAGDGSLLWDDRSSGGEGAQNGGMSVKVDEEGNAFVSGVIGTPLTGTDYLAMKFVPRTKIIRLSGTMAFGSVSKGTSKTSVLTIHNTGNSPLTITSITYPSGFSGAFSGSIPAGASQEVIVKFRPSLLQQYTGKITVFGNQTSGKSTLLISGNGI